MNALERHNRQQRANIETTRDTVCARHKAHQAARPTPQPLEALIARIGDELSKVSPRGPIKPLVEVVERERHDADIALRFPQLLKDGGPKRFIELHLPWIVETLSGALFADAFARVAVAGMYINITLSDRWLLGSAQAVVDAEADFGRSNALEGRRYVIDYSSPNVAKRLHAGHVRSTIIGHVLSNLYDANGALVFRVNHINDFGGFGFTLEGYRRFADGLAALPDMNERLIEIYRIRRTAERALAANLPVDELPAEDADVIRRYFPEAASREALVAAVGAFTAASDARFAALEHGEEAEVALWQEMVAASLADFEHFYDSLRVRIDFTIGESFYFIVGDQLVDRLLAEGKAVRYDATLAAADIALLDARRARDEITPQEYDSLKGFVEKDVGAALIPLDGGERYVVRRSDGRSIYATRDIGAVALRHEIFAPTDLVYVVGQEQQVHFDRLFRAAYATQLADPATTRFQHIYFGFYVDADTGRKLSSRDSVSSVNELLDSSIRYFRSRLSDRVGLSETELESAASELAIGSLIFNDLKQDVKGPVDIVVSDMETMISRFERSGAAYVVYAACRARSILRRYDRTPERIDTFAIDQLDAQEVSLLLKLQQIAQKIVTAAEQSNPSLLVRHLLDVATVYNSYYTRAPVLTDGVANPTRLLITAAVHRALVNGLLVCHVSCPAAI